MAEQQVLAVFLTNAIRTSAGPGPGAKELPPAEAVALVAGGGPAFRMNGRGSTAFWPDAHPVVS